jgi:hypothetical protein
MLASLARIPHRTSEDLLPINGAEAGASVGPSLTRKRLEPPPDLETSAASSAAQPAPASWLDRPLA